MAIPAKSAALLQKVALLDIVIGLGLLVYGLMSDNGTLAFLGVSFAVVAASMLVVARSQQADPGGPIVG